MPTKLGKYEIKSELGRGAMGVVYCAEDARLGRLVALKTMSGNLANDPELLKRFYREAQSAGQLHHPNIVTIYDIDEANGVPFIAMEFLEGDSLEKIISERKDVTVVKKLDILVQTLKGLHYAHHHGIVHRDVKPANIIVLTDGMVKLVDFGIARVTATSMTRTGIILGTPMYMSPEQISGQTVDARADIFSVGVILYEVLTYQNPFVAPDVPTILYKIMNVPPPPLAELIPNCPARLDEVVQRAVAKNREQRYQSAEDMAFELQHLADSLKRQTLDIYIEQGQAFIAEGNLTLAKDSLQKVLEIDSQHDLAKTLLHKVQGQIQTRQRSQRTEQLLRQAKEALQVEHYDEGITLLEELLQMEPQHSGALQYKERAIEKRDQRQRVVRHLQRAEKLVADADFKGAKAELEAALTLDRNHAEALKLMDYVQKELTEQERLRQVRQYTESARTHLAEKNYGRAVELLNKARELDPLNIDVETLLRLARTGQGQEERRQRLYQLLAETQEAMNREDYDRALSLAEQGLQDFPEDAQVLKLHGQATRLAEVQKKRRYVDEQLQGARDYVQKGEYSDALAVLERALETAPEDARLISFLKTVQEAQASATVEALRRQAIHEANDLIRHKDFGGAISILERALASCGISPEIGALLQYAREQQEEVGRQERLRQVLSRAQTLLREENFGEAIGVLERAQRETQASEVSALLAAAREQWQKFEQRRADIVERAQQFLTASKPANALGVMDTAPKTFFRNQEFQALYTQCREALNRSAALRSVADQIEQLLAAENFDEAEEALEGALKSFPGDQTLLALQGRNREEQEHARRGKLGKVLDDARVAITRGNFRGATDLVNAVAWDSMNLPDLAAQARALLKEAQRQAEISQKQTIVYRPVPIPQRPAAPPTAPTSDPGLFDSQKRLKEALQTRVAQPEPGPTVVMPRAPSPPPATPPEPPTPPRTPEVRAGPAPGASPEAPRPIAAPAPAPAPVAPVRPVPVIGRAPTIEAKRASRVPWVVGGLLLLVVAAVVLYILLRPPAAGSVQLSSTPWAEVVSVQKIGGGALNITGQTPLELSLPAGKYVIELRSGTSTEKVNVTVEAGKSSVINQPFPGVNVDGIVDELVSKY